jgi:hypothetical protein
MRSVSGESLPFGARSTFLRAVPVIGLYLNYKNSLDDCLTFRNPDPHHPGSNCVAIEQVDAAKYFQTCLVEIVNKNPCGPVVREEVPGGDKLLVPTKICKGQGVIIDHLEKSLGAAVMLDIRSSSRTDGRPVRAIAFG